MKNQLSRRDFMAIAPMATLGLVFSKHSNTWLDKPNSKFNGVQIGAITYSFRSMPHNIDQLLQFCIDSGVSAIEMMGDPAEDFAGKPKNPNPFRMGPPPRQTAGQPPQRPQMTEEQKAQMAEYNKAVAAWRATASMDKFKEIRKKFTEEQ